MQREFLKKAAQRDDQETVRRIISISPQTAREYAVDELLGDWGERVLSGQSITAMTILQEVRAIGAALDKLTGDRTVISAVQAIDRADAGSNSSAVTALAKGHIAYCAGNRAFQELFVAKSGPLLLNARAELAQGGSPIELWARVGLAGVDLYTFHYDASLKSLGEIVARAQMESLPALQGRALWGMGLISIRQGLFSDALRQYQSAASLFERAQEAQNLGFVHALIAEDLRFLGQGELAWRHRYRAAALLRNHKGSQRLHSLLWESGLAAAEEGEPWVALDFQNEDIRVAAESGDPGMVAEALIWRGKTHMSLGNLDQAFRDIVKARRWNYEFSDIAVRRRLDVDAIYTEGEVLRRTAPAEALRPFSEAIGYYEVHHLVLDLASSYVGRARAYLAEGRKLDAEADLKAAISIFEKGRASLANDDLRTTYSEAIQELFDEMILLQAEELGRPVAALEYSERARIIPLAENPQEKVGVVSAANMLLEIRRRRIVLIEYALLRDRLLTWMVHANGIDLISQKVAFRDLDELTRQFVVAVRSGKDEKRMTALSTRLYTLLIPHAVERLSDDIKICIVPDKILNGVPFAALENPLTGRYIVESHALIVSPSSTLVMGDARHDNGLLAVKVEPSALLVSATEFDRSIFPDVSELPGASKEIVDIQEVYSGSRVIQGKDATRGQILNELDKYDVLEYAGHAVLNFRHPAYSYLLLTPSPEQKDSGALFAHEIASRRFKRLRLVVLSACNTLGPVKQRTEGFSGIARPFLDAGATAVLGSLWKVEDDTAARLLPGFHRRFLITGDAALSLRQAQLALLGDPEGRFKSPSSWAGFEVMGIPNRN
jgi:CHAT domain-containing protein